MQPKRIQFLYTNIGRGHPFYLDGIIEALIRKGQIGLVRDETDVFAISSGASKAAWQLVRKMYQFGSTGGLMGSLYNRLRSGTDYNHPGLIQRLLSKSVAKKYGKGTDPVVVAHPILVAALNGRADVIYQHGELVAPSESLVRGAAKVMVPTKDTANLFVKSGYAQKDVLVTGLCIETSLVRQAGDAFESRIKRLGQTESRTGAFFSSGAEPPEHVKKLSLAALSVAKAGGSVIVFTQLHGRLQRACVEQFAKHDLHYSIMNDDNPFVQDSSSITLVTYSSRRELTHRTAQLFPAFDFMVAPAHERSNWALGLGLPMFILGPQIGSFAPCNQRLLLDEEVAISIETEDHAKTFERSISGSGTTEKLLSMAQAGWGRYPINGFETVADYLHNEYAQEQ
jgi:hypothetical protein